MLMRALYPLRATSYLVLQHMGLALTALPFSTWAWPSLNPPAAHGPGPHCTPFQHMGLALTQPLPRPGYFPPSLFSIWAHHPLSRVILASQAHPSGVH